MLWQKWIFALIDQVAAPCPAHPTCTFPFSLYLQFSKTLNFSSSSWPSSIALRERFLFWQNLQLNFTEHNGCPMPCLGARGWIPHASWIAGPSLSAAETEEYLQDRATSEGPHGSTVWDTLWLFHFFAEGTTLFWFVAQVLCGGNLLDSYFFPCHLSVSLLAPCSPPLVHIHRLCFVLKEGCLIFFRREDNACPWYPAAWGKGGGVMALE